MFQTTDQLVSWCFMLNVTNQLLPFVALLPFPQRNMCWAMKLTWGILAQGFPPLRHDVLEATRTKQILTWWFNGFMGLIIPHTEEMLANFLQPVQLIQWILASPWNLMKQRPGKISPVSSHLPALIAAIFSLSFLFFSSFASNSIKQFCNSQAGFRTGVPDTVWHTQK